MQSRPLLAGVVSALAVLVAACGASSSSGSTSPAGSSPAASPSAASTSATVAVATNPKYGQILVDSKGMTLYLFVADTGTQSTCYTSCAAVWPPLLMTGSPQAGTGVQASLLGTTARTDGKTEATCGGHPLYYFIQDKQPGDTTGQGVNGFGGLWWVLNAACVAITTK